jgi:hypothetical protein
MPTKPPKPPAKDSPPPSKKPANKPKYEPPKLEKFEQLEKLIVSGE